MRRSTPVGAATESPVRTSQYADGIPQRVDRLRALLMGLLPRASFISATVVLLLNGILRNSIMLSKPLRYQFSYCQAKDDDAFDFGALGFGAFLTGLELRLRGCLTCIGLTTGLGLALGPFEPP